MKIKYAILLLILFPIACKPNSEIDQKAQSAYVTVKFNGLNAPDSLSLYFMRYTINDQIGHNFIEPKIITSYKQNDQFIFEIPALQRPAYFSLNKGDFNPYNASPLFFLENYLIAPNDSIIINVSKRIDSTCWDKAPGLREYLLRYKKMAFSFSGRGSTKNRCRYKVDSVLMTHQGMLVVQPISEDTSNYFNLVFPKGLQIIEKYKDSINRLSYEILKADFVGIVNNFRYRLISPSLKNFPEDDKAAINKKIHFLKKDFTTTTASLNNQEAKAISYYYPISVLYLNYDLFTVKGYATFNMHGDSAFSWLANHYNGELRDKLLTYFIINYYLRIPDKNSLLNRALNIVSTPYCKKLLINFEDSHSYGSLISNIPLKDENGKSVRLTKFIGKVIFLDFWFTGCGACKAYYQKSISKVEKAFADNPDVMFVSICIDKQKNIWLNSINKDLYSTNSLPNVINLYTGSKGGNHPIVDFYKISGYPTSMLFGKDGKLLNLSVNDLKDSIGLTRRIRMGLKK